MTTTALEPISAVIPEVTNSNGKIITTSVAVANYFHKRHDNVMDKIRSIMEECDPSYRLLNFKETVYHRENPSGGQEIPTAMFELTRDAFVLIVMGFTGKKALQWKIDYINAFNQMEAELQKPAQVMPLDYEFLTVVRGGKVVDQRFASPDEIFLTFDSFKEMAGRLGYLIIHGDDVKKLTIDEFLKLGSTQSKVAKISSR
ncbi:Rha family transcriptional regulator [Serratia liquefaciens]|uniref:Rha family transcriptional regulator n=1 Tax=Serratia liquefaciens TaxID=614 RepID=A0A515CTK7_SERLI|nr:Rha family transcriptional regulator [Serratia liquefaciens]QDL31502.1 hypothetical protein EGO53_06775 [Serratia liquefaciens]